jgi:anti-anti-sigma factor
MNPRFSPSHIATCRVAPGIVRPQVSIRSTIGQLLEIVAVTVDETQSTLQVEGELDLATAGLLAATLDDELRQGHRFVRLDLSRLSFMDCAGLRVLTRAHTYFLAARGTVVLTGLRPPITRLLTITGLDMALFVADGPSLRASPASRVRRQQLTSVKDPAVGAAPQRRRVISDSDEVIRSLADGQP